MFVDNNPEALSVIRRNITSCSFEKQAQIIKWDIKNNLNCFKAVGQTFDLVFMDPPYNRGMIKPALFNLEQTGSLKKGARIVVEHSPFEPISDRVFMFEIEDQRKYGKTLVSFLTFVIRSPI